MQRNSVVKKVVAIEVKKFALHAVENLSKVLEVAKLGCDDDELAVFHKEVGLLIGKIQMGVLEPIYSQYPDLDDLI